MRVLLVRDSDRINAHFKNKFQGCEIHECPYVSKWVFSLGQSRNACDDFGCSVKHMARPTTCVPLSEISSSYLIQRYPDALSHRQLLKLKRKKQKEWMQVTASLNIRCCLIPTKTTMATTLYRRGAALWGNAFTVPCLGVTGPRSE